MFDSSAENPLSLEWMLTEKVDARSLEAVYTHELTSRKPSIFDPYNTAGHHVLEEVAGYSRRLGDTKFQHIGSLYIDCTRATSISDR